MAPTARAAHRPDLKHHASAPTRAHLGAEQRTDPTWNKNVFPQRVGDAARLDAHARALEREEMGRPVEAGRVAPRHPAHLQRARREAEPHFDALDRDVEIAAATRGERFHRTREEQPEQPLAAEPREQQDPQHAFWDCGERAQKPLKTHGAQSQVPGKEFVPMIEARAGFSV